MARVVTLLAVVWNVFSFWRNCLTFLTFGVLFAALTPACPAFGRDHQGIEARGYFERFESTFEFTQTIPFPASLNVVLARKCLGRGDTVDRCLSFMNDRGFILHAVERDCTR